MQSKVINRNLSNREIPGQNNPEGEFFVKKVMSWEGVRREVSVTAVNLKPSSLLTHSQIQIFWLKIHPQYSDTHGSV